MTHLGTSVLADDDCSARSKSSRHLCKTSKLLSDLSDGDQIRSRMQDSTATSLPFSDSTVSHYGQVDSGSRMPLLVLVVPVA